MPAKMTYGKRKKSILSLFPVLRDDDKPLQSPKTKTGKRVSATISMTAFYAKHSSIPNQPSDSALDDSIEEMTSMLIDDTTMNQLTGEPGKRLSNLGSAKVLTKPPQQGSFYDKALPRLPQLSFDGEDDWTTPSHPAIEEFVEVSDKIDEVNDRDDLDSCPPPVSRQPAHARKSSVPSLPRRSSKRRSRQRVPREIFEAQNHSGDESRQQGQRKFLKTTQQILRSPHFISNENTDVGSPKTSPDISQQIEAMLAASKALKPEGDGILLNSPALSKKSGVRGNRVLSKMKNAITGHLHDKRSRMHHNQAKNEYLLDPDLSQLPDYDEEASTISAMELRINEGINFGNPKIQSLTGHGTIRRKPIADDGRSLMSRKSVELLSLEDVYTKKARGLASIDDRRQSSVSFDQSTSVISSPAGRSYQFKDEIRRLSGGRKSGLSFDADYDSLFSSSPVAQSTPRVRLEPTFEENGDKKLRNVPADSRSLFDPDISVRDALPDMGVVTTPPQNAATRRLLVKRNNSQVKEANLGVKSHMSKRRKKHPSPSKAELEGLEDALAHYSPRLVSMEIDTPEELTLSFGELRTGEMLQPKDNNAPLKQAAKRGKKGNRLGLFGKSKQAVAGPSMAEPARRPLLKPLKPSMIPKPAGAPTMKRRIEPRKYRLMSLADESAMDTDELQWESTAYHIGMRG